MKKTLVLILFGLKVFGQEFAVSDSINKTNPVVFIESCFGFGAGSRGGIFFIGGSLNCQFNKKDLITARYVSNISFGSSYVQTSPFTVFPFFVRTEEQSELALLYGKRFINDSHSFSLSSGISFVSRDFYNEGSTFHENYYGVPFELNIKWFKGKKSRFRAYYGLIPIGKKKVSFGRSVGFKIIGNISKSSYVAYGFTYGFGWHKKY